VGVPIRLDERLDLRHRADDAREPGPDPAGERLEALRRAGAEHEVVRRRPQRAGRDLAAVLREPELVLEVEPRAVAQRPREAEDQIVAGLVVEQERAGALEPVRGIRHVDHVHGRSLSCLGNA
jgi:hypothetical protein